MSDESGQQPFILFGFMMNVSQQVNALMSTYCEH